VFGWSLISEVKLVLSYFSFSSVCPPQSGPLAIQAVAAALSTWRLLWSHGRSRLLILVLLPPDRSFSLCAAPAPAPVAAPSPPRVVGGASFPPPPPEQQLVAVIQEDALARLARLPLQEAPPGQTQPRPPLGRTAGRTEQEPARHSSTAQPPCALAQDNFQLERADEASTAYAGAPFRTARELLEQATRGGAQWRAGSGHKQGGTGGPEPRGPRGGEREAPRDQGAPHADSELQPPMEGGQEAVDDEARSRVGKGSNGIVSPSSIMSPSTGAPPPQMPLPAPTCLETRVEAKRRPGEEEEEEGRPGLASSFFKQGAKDKEHSGTSRPAVGNGRKEGELRQERETQAEGVRASRDCVDDDRPLAESDQEGTIMRTAREALMNRRNKVAAKQGQASSPPAATKLRQAERKHERVAEAPDTEEGKVAAALTGIQGADMQSPNVDATLQTTQGGLRGVSNEDQGAWQDKEIDLPSHDPPHDEEALGVDLDSIQPSSGARSLAKFDPGSKSSAESGSAPTELVISVITRGTPLRGALLVDDAIAGTSSPIAIRKRAATWTYSQASKEGLKSCLVGDTS
jgi:hypothetical protein